MNSKSKRRIRKAHRFLGIVLGFQFLMWTISGLYFSWSDIDQIHGDYFKKEGVEKIGFQGLIGIDSLLDQGVHSLTLKDINGVPHYWVNEAFLINALTGKVRPEGIGESEAIAMASKLMLDELKLKKVELIHEVGAHHEYRGRPLPAYVITYDHPHDVKAYVSKQDGEFQRVRHRNWRWFDFLWMTHTMDYQSRDDFNTVLLRVFSVFGLVTVLSGFLLFFTSLNKRK